jgi:hypothetical protein
MHEITGASCSKVVDLYNSATGAWSTAQLSVARYGLAATSVGNAAIFAGGVLIGNGGASQWRDAQWEGGHCIFCHNSFWMFCALTSGRISYYCCYLEHANTGLNERSNVVDMYNSVTGTWSAAQLSEARYALAAASAGNFAIFAGGNQNGSL